MARHRYTSPCVPQCGNCQHTALAQQQLQRAAPTTWRLTGWSFWLLIAAHCCCWYRRGRTNEWYQEHCITCYDCKVGCHAAGQHCAICSPGPHTTPHAASSADSIRRTDVHGNAITMCQYQPALAQRHPPPFLTTLWIAAGTPRAAPHHHLVQAPINAAPEKRGKQCTGCRKWFHRRCLPGSAGGGAAAVAAAAADAAAAATAAAPSAAAADSAADTAAAKDGSEQEQEAAAEGARPLFYHAPECEKVRTHLPP
jgi:hypothetical protein